MIKTAVLLLSAMLPLAAQWLNYPEKRTPRTRDGKPNLTAPTPRMNGKPDLSGVWQAERTPEGEITSTLGENAPKIEIDINDVTKQWINVFWGSNPRRSRFNPRRQQFTNN